MTIKVYIHLRSLNGRHIELVEATGVKVNFNGIIFLLNVMKIPQLIKKLLMENTQPDNMLMP
jgi:hypothetical protein